MDRTYSCSYKTVDSVDKNQYINEIEEHKEIVHSIALHNKEMAIKNYSRYIENNRERIKEGYFSKLEKSLVI